MAVKDRKALHRYAVLVTQGVMQRQEANHRLSKLESDVQTIAQTMREGFASVDKRFDDLIHQMDKRFEAVDKRFEAADKRFDDMDYRWSRPARFRSGCFNSELTAIERPSR